jgi:AhpD family alkylhydroperoxidase
VESGQSSCAVGAPFDLRNHRHVPSPLAQPRHRPVRKPARPGPDRIGVWRHPQHVRIAAHSPAALASLWGSFAALGGGTLPPALRELIAVAIADRNACHYCLAAYTTLGRRAGISHEDLTDAQLGRSGDPKTAAALAFVLKVVDQRAAIDGSDVGALRDAGFDDGAIVEILATIALNIFTNYLNVAFDVPVDFPQVQLRHAA